MLEFTLGAPQSYRVLTVYPLVFPEKLELPYSLLGDALAAGTVEVTEVGSGTVPELTVENTGQDDVLILDGEQLIGARQNRMTNRSMILAAKKQTRIPVSCMEEGRWHFDSRRFSHGKYYSPSKVRSHARKQEAKAVRMGRAVGQETLASAQSDVWDEIHRVAESLGAHSPTGTLDHVYDARSRDLERWLEAFGWVDDQVGLLAFVEDEVLGLDVIGGHRLYASLHKRLVSGYVMDAMSSRARRARRKPSGSAANLFLEEICEATRTEAPTVGNGTYRVLSGRVMGAELEASERLVHLSAFPVDEDGGDQDARRAPIRSPRYRRRYYT